MLAFLLQSVFCDTDQFASPPGGICLRNQETWRSSRHPPLTNERDTHRPLQNRVLDNLAVGEEPRGRACTPGEAPEGFLVG